MRGTHGQQARLGGTCAEDARPSPDKRAEEGDAGEEPDEAFVPRVAAQDAPAAKADEGKRLSKEGEHGGELLFYFHGRDARCEAAHATVCIKTHARGRGCLRPEAELFLWERGVEDGAELVALRVGKAIESKRRIPATIGEASAAGAETQDTEVPEGEHEGKDAEEKSKKHVRTAVESPGLEKGEGRGEKHDEAANGVHGGGNFLS